MDFKKIISSALACALLIGGAVIAAPSVSQSSDSVEAVVEEGLNLSSETSITLDIGARASSSNVRYAEIDGVQTLISENNNTYTVTVDSDDMLVEIVEKTSADAETVVKTQYFYIDADTKTVKALDKMNTHMQSYDEKAIRVVGDMGVRFKAHVQTEAKYEETQFYVDEYGYILSTEASLAGSDLTFNSKRYVKGVGFSRKDGINIVFDGTDDEFDVFTLVVKNIPVSSYETVLVTKTYTKLTVYGNQFVVYGEPLYASVFDIASGLFADDCSNTSIAKIMLDYFEYKGTDAAFTNSVAASSVDGTSVTVGVTFTNTANSGDVYNVYLAEYNSAGTLVDVHKSSDYTIVKGANSANASFTIESEENQVKAFVVTEEFLIAGVENVILWAPATEEFNDTVASTAFTKNTVYADYFNPDSSVTVIESIALVANAHAKYYDEEITADDTTVYEYLNDLDDASEISSSASISANYATIAIDEENSYLYGTSVIRSNGAYDPQVIIRDLELDARKYNKITLRMKYEAVDGGLSEASLANATLQFFFKTTYAQSFSESKSIKYALSNVSNVTEWFEFELDMSSDTDWVDFITDIRIDPLNGNAKFYIDYIMLSESDASLAEDWYDKYLDYSYNEGIIESGEFAYADYETPVTRESFLTLLASSIPESEFSAINDVSAIPDIGRDDKYSSVYLTLYKSGVTLGFDDAGNIGLDDELKRSELFAVLNRTLVPDNRISGTVDASWDDQTYLYDMEFNSESELDGLTFRKLKTGTTPSIVDGALVMEGQWDAGFYKENLAIDANYYTSIVFRIKPEYDSEEPTTAEQGCGVYFKPTEGYSGSLDNYTMGITARDVYLDPFGWYVLKLDMILHPDWENEICYFRFDTMNGAGKYTIDYVRFIWSEYSELRTQEDLINAGYTETRLFYDEGFERGFYVNATAQTGTKGTWNDYCSLLDPDYLADETTPYWQIGPWWQGTDILVEGQSEKVIPLFDYWDNRDTESYSADELPYVFADTKGVNVIKYDPELKSISQTLNCTNIYNYDPHISSEYKWWPHQLLETHEGLAPVDRTRNTAAADRMFVELDVRLTKFEDNDTENVSTEETPYRKVCDYLIYFYLRPLRDPSQRIWFGMHVFGGSNPTAPTNVTPGWAPDSAAHQYMYGIKQASVYDGIENSFNPTSGQIDVGEDWKQIRLDVTGHIDRAIEWANRDNIFGFEVTKEDMFFNGVNIGFEAAGNYDCTIEIKNFNMVAYNLPE